ncbi:gene transfer agent family protein [Rhizobium sp. 32-5/1]|uniref:gene transfer agent family protein n=1 Tax=Rhizobium sp. 32-5/1 TaxID=3019602 RepID=UPI00240D21D9|nr:gene transfer agent family protein [Rhizobium sp. 32-5/1]WEZ83988.1 gene transfer agent family protein [Rhizobium sp. 32-5/1]
MGRNGATGRANRHRGEIEAVIDGERRILCLTLAGLAELETAFAADNLMDLATRFSAGSLKANDIIRILSAGLRGGGNIVSDEDVAMMTIEGGLAGMARLTGELLAATFGETQEAAANP